MPTALNCDAVNRDFGWITGYPYLTGKVTLPTIHPESSQRCCSAPSLQIPANIVARTMTLAFWHETSTGMSCAAGWRAET